jgi:peptide chain release factor 3
MGRDFKGVVNVLTGEVLLFSGGKHGQERVVTEVRESLDACGDILSESRIAQVKEQLELIEIAGESWDLDAFRRGELSPLFWGSAMSNFGVEPLLSFLAEHAAPPHSRIAVNDKGEEEIIAPDMDDFSGFVFKIQANMNPRHRDRIAFMRVVSGRFERGMDVQIGRSGDKLRLSKPHTFMAQERSIVEEAWPGDIVGLYDSGKIRLGDTLSTGGRLQFPGIPRFAPEHFARVRLEDPLKRKQLVEGLRQLAHEGAIQVFYRPKLGPQDPWLGAVGILQFEVLKQRLENEYSVVCDLEMLQFRFARWVRGSASGLEWLQKRRDYPVVEDRNGDPVVLTESQWPLDYALRQNEGLEFFDVEPL